MPATPAKNSPSSRRDFLKTAAVAAAGTAAGLTVARSAHAGGSDVLKIGLIGCGGRGTGAAGNALTADPNTRLVAMADAFGDRLEKSLEGLKANKEFGCRVAVDKEHCFTGFDAYKQLLASDVDVVLLATPPHFRPSTSRRPSRPASRSSARSPWPWTPPASVVLNGRAAKKRSLNRGLRAVLAVTRRSARRSAASATGPSATSGHPVNVHHRHALASRPRSPTGAKWNTRCATGSTSPGSAGDHNVEQHVHSLDKAMWVMGDEPPVQAIGLGGRQVRTGDKWGDIYDHHAVVYEYANGTPLFAYTAASRPAATARSTI